MCVLVAGCESEHARVVSGCQHFCGVAKRSFTVHADDSMAVGRKLRGGDNVT